MRDKLPQKPLHCSPPRPPLSLSLSIPFATLSYFELAFFFKHEDLEEIWPWHVCLAYELCVKQYEGEKKLALLTEGTILTFHCRI